LAVLELGYVFFLIFFKQTANNQQMRSRRSLLESRAQSPTSEEEHESELERSNGLAGPSEPRQ
jgi:hypothetical protein